MDIVYIPDQPWELALVLCLFEAYGVPCFVHNLYYGGLYPACQIDLLNLRRVYVPAEMASYARQLLKDFYPDLGTPPEIPEPDMVRIVIEGLVGGWFVPGNKWPRQAAT